VIYYAVFLHLESEVGPTKPVDIRQAAQQRPRADVVTDLTGGHARGWREVR